MKRLLLLTNAVFLVVMVSSCQTRTKTQAVQEVETKPPMTATPVATDTTKVQSTSSPAGLVGTGQGTIKDSAKTPDSTRAIIHGAPNQDRIDSIRNTKTKIKK